MKALETLQTEKDALSKLRVEVETKKNEKAELETEARKKHDDAWEGKLFKVIETFIFADICFVVCSTRQYFGLIDTYARVLIYGFDH